MCEDDPFSRYIIQYLLIYEDIRYMWNVLTTDAFGEGNVSLCMITVLIHFVH